MKSRIMAVLHDYSFVGNKYPDSEQAYTAIISIVKDVVGEDKEPKEIWGFEESEPTMHLDGFSRGYNQAKAEIRKRLETL